LQVGSGGNVGKHNQSFHFRADVHLYSESPGTTQCLPGFRFQSQQKLNMAVRFLIIIPGLFLLKSVSQITIYDCHFRIFKKERDKKHFNNT
jgi:hypothetical protein